MILYFYAVEQTSCDGSKTARCRALRRITGDAQLAKTIRTCGKFTAH